MQCHYKLPLILIVRSQAAAIAKSTGCKGSYPISKLKFHNPIQQTVPDS